MESEQEYLIAYGLLGDFGRFRPLHSLDCRRGDLAVVQTQRGVEMGQVLCRATPRHAHFLPGPVVGPLLRMATNEDEWTAERVRQRSQEVFEEARRRAEALSLP